MIYIYGAFDRFNYGDLLFPKILQIAFKSANIAFPVKLLGLVEADLTSNGGDCVEPVSKYINQFNLNDILIIAGGEVIGASITDLYFSLRKSRFLFFLNKLAGKAGLKNFVSPFCKLLLDLNLQYPYLLDENQVGCKIIYNAVGGSFFSDEVLAPIKNSTYFSTRSFSLYNSLQERIEQENEKNKIQLFPDSAAIVSDYFDKRNIRIKVLPENITILESLKFSYIIFQVSKRYYSQHKRAILKQLSELYAKSGLPILLVPIGIAFGHEDHVACRDIKSLLSIPIYLLYSKTIYDIMYSIANARLFIGTSLHGNITAMSYNVSNIGIGGNKLDDYLKKWGVGLQKIGCVLPEDISIFALKVLNQNSNIYKAENIKHKELAYRNIKNITNFVTGI